MFSKHRGLVFVVLAITTAAAWYLMQKGPTEIEGEVQTAGISFSAQRPSKNKGLFASPTTVDITVYS